jgi:Rieske Fe-S protein
VLDGLRRLAAYREPDRALHAVSATCTHLYCEVQVPRVHDLEPHEPERRYRSPE